MTGKILSCLHRPRSEVRVGGIGTVVALGQKVAPWMYDRLVRRAFERLGFGPQDAPSDTGNVFETSRT